MINTEECDYTPIEKAHHESRFDYCARTCTKSCTANCIHPRNAVKTLRPRRHEAHVYLYKCICKRSKQHDHMFCLSGKGL